MVTDLHGSIRENPYQSVKSVCHSVHSGQASFKMVLLYSELNGVGRDAGCRKDDVIDPVIPGKRRRDQYVGLIETDKIRTRGRCNERGGCSSDRRTYGILWGGAKSGAESK